MEGPRIQPNLTTNESFAQKMLAMAKLPDKNARQKKAYKEGAKAFRDAKVPIMSGADAKKLPGVGESISKKFQEFLDTGHIAELEKRPQEEVDREQAINLFDSIAGVGQITAAKWYDQLGLRTFEDLARIYPTMTTEQKAGYYFYHDLNQKVPRAEIDYVNSILHNIFNPLKIKFIIAGSYRRGLPQSGDIDVLVENPGNLTLNQVLGFIRPSNLIIGDLAEGEVHYRGIIRVQPNLPVRRFDVKLIDQKHWPFGLLHYTGSGGFNEHLRELVKARGFSLSENGLHDTKGNYYDAKSEEEIFNLIGVKYIPPEGRTETVIPEIIGTGVMQTKQTGKWYADTPTFYYYIPDNLKYNPNAPNNIAAFDLDGTIITTKTGDFRKAVDDLVFLQNRKETLQNYLNHNYVVVIFTNQLSRFEAEKQLNFGRITYFLNELNLPVLLFMSLAKDEYRKPEIGMWKKFSTMMQIGSAFYVGDQETDKSFAEKAKIPFFEPVKAFGI
jgi:DNA polymerase beta